MHAQACVCTPLFTFAPGTFTCDCEWPARDSEDIREGSAPRASLSHLPISVWLFGNGSVCQHPPVLSHLGSCSLALEPAWVTSSCALAVVICVWKYHGALSAASGSRVQAGMRVFLLSLKPSWHLGTMFHLLTRLRVRKTMPINFIIGLLDCSDQSQWFVGLDEEHCLLPVI